MKWIGLTGGIASGKSTAAHFLRGLGIPVADADEISRDLMRPGEAGYCQAVKSFGSEILTIKNEIDRRKLGILVFSDPLMKKKLEEILHPLIRDRVTLWREHQRAQGQDLAVYDIPLLFEVGQDQSFDRILLIAASESIQRNRLKIRDGLNDLEIDLRFKNQIPMSEKVKKSTDVIWNSGGPEALEEELKKWLQSL